MVIIGRNPNIPPQIDNLPILELYTSRLVVAGLALAFGVAKVNCDSKGYDF